MSNKIEVGSPQFDRAIFCTPAPIDEQSSSYYSFNEHRPHKLGTDDIYDIPVYDSQYLHLFMIFSRAIPPFWTVTFSKVREHKGEVIDFSAPITTGRAINLLSMYSPKTANRLLNYFNNLQVIKRGAWHLIEHHSIRN